SVRHLHRRSLWSARRLLLACRLSFWLPYRVILLRDPEGNKKRPPESHHSTPRTIQKRTAIPPRFSTCTIRACSPLPTHVWRHQITGGRAPVALTGADWQVGSVVEEAPPCTLAVRCKPLAATYWSWSWSSIFGCLR